MRRPYRYFATAFLESMLSMYRRINIGGIFCRAIVDINAELTLRAMEEEAAASGAYLCAAILGEQ